MATNKFAARCTRCGATVAPNDGVVTGEVGARTVTHLECVPSTEPTRSFTIRAAALVPDLLVLPDAHRSEQRRRVLGVVAALGVVVLAGISVLLFTGEGNEGTTRTTGNLQPTTTLPAPSSSVAIQVAGVVETRPPTTLAIKTVVASPTEAPATSVSPTNELLAVPPTSPPPTAPPATPAPTVPPTAAPPTTVPVPTTAPPTTTQPVTTTTKRAPTTTTPVTTTTKRKGVLGLLG
jgi:hypothetical protein